MVGELNSMNFLNSKKIFSEMHNLTTNFFPLFKAFYFLAKSYLESLNVMDSPIINNHKNQNNPFTNKSNVQNPVRKLPLRPINNDHLRISMLNFFLF